MDDNFGEWVESIGVASGHGYQEVDVASGWNLWLLLECIGVVSGCCCKEVHVYRYPHFSLLHLYILALFLAAASLLFCSVLKCFFGLVYVILCNIANIAQRTFEIVQKVSSHNYN